MVKYIGENIASMSSGFKNVSSQMGTFLTKSEQEPLAISTTPVPSSSSDVSPNSTTSILARLPPPQLDCSQYPKVQQWFPDKYNGRRKTSKAGKAAEGESLEEAQGEILEEAPKSSVLSSYMEDENGCTIPSATRNAVREMARQFFWQLLTHGQAPAKWGEATIDVSNEMIFQLETAFPWLRLCENHWKAKKIATNSYSQWYPGALLRFQGEQARKSKGSTEVIDVDDDEPHLKRPLKRRVPEDDGAGRPKRPRLDESPSCVQTAKTTTSRRRVCIFYNPYYYMRH